MKTTILTGSDIHFHQYDNGITLDDVINVGQQFIDLCKLVRPDLVLLCGDYSLSHNPTYQTSLAINNFFVELNKLDLPMAVLVGNHDRVFKSEHKLHILEHFRLFDDLDNIKIMDSTGLYMFKSGTRMLNVWAVPAGHKIPDYELAPNEINICAAHATFIDSAYQNGTRAKTGESAADFDKGFSVVLCGDNHQFQILPGFTTTTAVSVGAPMQHNWGDTESTRGFVQADIEDGKVTITQIPSIHPKFIKCECIIKSEADLEDYVRTHVDMWKGNVVRLQVSGSNDLLNSIDIQQWKDACQNTGVRSMDIKPNFTTNEVVVDKQIFIKTDAEEWEQFLLKRQSEFAELDLEKLKHLGLDFIND